jgi:hypothetical protein
VKARRPRPPKYGPKVVATLVFGWAVLGMPAGKRLAPMHRSPHPLRAHPRMSQRLRLRAPLDMRLQDVTIIDMRRPAAAAQDEPDGASGRQYRRRWWSGGHWRQQACGPGRTQHKPILVSPYVKGSRCSLFTAGRKRKGSRSKALIANASGARTSRLSADHTRPVRNAGVQCVTPLTADLRDARRRPWQSVALHQRAAPMAAPLKTVLDAAIVIKKHR